MIEINVTRTLHYFLLNTSKKEYLESIQESEFNKNKLQAGNLTMTLNQQTQPKE